MSEHKQREKMAEQEQPVPVMVWMVEEMSPGNRRGEFVKRKHLVLARGIEEVGFICSAKYGDLTSIHLVGPIEPSEHDAFVVLAKESVDGSALAKLQKEWIPEHVQSNVIPIEKKVVTP